jgi:hypothetical protein
VTYGYAWKIPTRAFTTYTELMRVHWENIERLATEMGMVVDWKSLHWIDGRDEPLALPEDVAYTHLRIEFMEEK